jgi:hypothetical protein
MGDPAAGPPPGGPGPACDPPPPQSGPTTPPYNNAFACFYDYAVDVQSGCTPPSYVAVDLLVLRTAFNKNDQAFSTNGHFGGSGGPGDVNFSNSDWTFAPRVTLQIFPFDEWGIGASWYQFTPSDQRYNLANSNPNVTVTSARLPIGPRITSPQDFSTISSLTGSPFTSSVAAGSPDNLVFDNSFSMQVADLELLRFYQCGGAYGTIGFGARYAYISHSYSASRVNNANLSGTLGSFDPFDDDGDAAFNGAKDFNQVFYGYNYSGIGPLLSVDMTWPMNSPLQIFGKVSGSVLMGSRRESVYNSFQQTVSLSDPDDSPEPQQTFGSSGLTHSTSYAFIFMPVAEAEVGVSLQLLAYRVHPILKVSGVAQYWYDGGNSTDPNAALFMFGVNATAGIEF